MISRYTRPEMGRIWSEENGFQKWLEVEILAAEGLARLGKVPKAAITRIRRKARFNVKRIREIEAEVKHEIIAFLSSVAESIGDDARYLHVGMTSSDVMDTALALQFKDASAILEDDIKNLMKALRQQARKYKWTVQIGRTHGVHAEPITFGLKLALWYQEMARHLVRFRAAVDDICVGQISGAVGTFAQISPKVEAYVCRKAGLKPALVSNQIIQRDRHAYYFATLAIIASSLEKFAVEIRHLQRTEVQEAEEPFTQGQKGSSAMPHKRNPILSENVSGLARLMRSYALAAMENVPLWHERDISHSSGRAGDRAGRDHRARLHAPAHDLRARQFVRLSGKHAAQSRQERRHGVLGKSSARFGRQRHCTRCCLSHGAATCAQGRPRRRRHEARAVG